MAATSQVLPGIVAGAYRNTGTYGTPVWSEQTSVLSGTVGDQWEYGDASSRASRAKTFRKTQIDLSSSLNMLADPAAADYIAFYAAAQSPGTVLDLLLLNAKITTEGSIGIRAEFDVSRQPENQEAGGIIYNVFELKPRKTANGVPSTVVMGTTSTPAITAL